MTDGSDRMVIGIVMDEATMGFCEHCGISREKLGRDHVRPGSQRLLRVCAGCDATCCPNCWNLRVDRCLVCVPFSVPVAPVSPPPALVVARVQIPSSRRAISRHRHVPTIARATSLAGVRRSLLAVGYVLVAALILTRSPLFLNASAAGSSPPPPPSPEASGPASSLPAAVPADAASPTPVEPSATVDPTPTN